MTNKEYIKQATDEELIALFINLENGSVVPKPWACYHAGILDGCHVCPDNHSCFRRWLESEVDQ